MWFWNANNFFKQANTEDSISFFKISLNQDYYYQKDEIQGQISIKFKSPQKINQLRLHIEGVEWVKFWSSTRREVNDGEGGTRTETEYKKHETSHEWINRTIAEWSDNPEEKLTYRFNFSFELPADIPASFEHSWTSAGARSGACLIVYK